MPKVICYLGPSLDLKTARSILPDAVFLPPVRHADIISDIPKYSPTHILIIDGTFSQDLPVWHKEISFAALSGTKVYGASSMGALRASELADHGIMIGCGKIFRWYWEGVLDADDEVAVLYHRSPSGDYSCDTCPLVNVRAGLLKSEFDDNEVDQAFTHERAIHYAQRSPPVYAIDQKRLDAIELLSTYQDLDYCTDARPDLSYLTPIFASMLERERRVEYHDCLLTMQNVDSYISLHSPSHDQISWDSKNRGLALILAGILDIPVTPHAVELEWTTFCARHHLFSWESFQEWLQANLMTKAEFDVMTIQNAKIRILQDAYVTTSMFSRQTRPILDYMRTHDALRLWVEDCCDCERTIVDKENREMVEVDMTTSLETLLMDHFGATGLEISGSLTSFLRDSGIGAIDELRVCLQRYALARTTGK